MAKLPLVLSRADLKLKTSTPGTDLMSAISAANGKARSFVYDAYDVIDLARRAEHRLDAAGLNQTDRIGVEMSARPAGPSAKAYKFAATSRRVTIRRTAKGWVLASITEDVVYPKQSEHVRYYATDAQIAEIKRRAVEDIMVMSVAH